MGLRRLHPSPRLAHLDKRDGGVRDAEPFSETQRRSIARPSIPPIGEQSLDLCDLTFGEQSSAPRPAIVASNVDRLGFDDFQVLWPIVAADLIDVMNDLAWSQQPSDLGFSDEPRSIDVAIGIGSVMVRAIDADVTGMLRHPTSPSMRALSGGLYATRMATDEPIPSGVLPMPSYLITAATRTQRSGPERLSERAHPADYTEEFDVRIRK